MSRAPQPTQTVNQADLDHETRMDSIVKITIADVISNLKLPAKTHPNTLRGADHKTEDGTPPRNRKRNRSKSTKQRQRSGSRLFEDNRPAPRFIEDISPSKRAKLEDNSMTDDHSAYSQLINARREDSEQMPHELISGTDNEVPSASVQLSQTENMDIDEEGSNTEKLLRNQESRQQQQ